jgi:DNA-binding XRE family transcriptional regulator
LPPNYPKRLKTLGDHIRKRRLDLGLLQKKVAQNIGVSRNTIYNWETNMTQPSFRWLPKIIDFLGYASYSPPQSVGERLTMVRKFLGLSQKELAAMIGVDPSTIHNWEFEKHKLTRRASEIIMKFFNGKI